MKGKPQKEWQWTLLAFTVNFCIAMIALLPFIVAGGGLFTVADDFNAEQLTYNMLCNQALKRGDWLWSWYTDIGSDFVATYSFYTLGSPFFWIQCLFPASWFPYLVGWLYMLKYAVAGLTSYLYLRRFVTNQSAIAGSILYAFSGFQCSALLFYHFHDVVALFPLLLWGVENLLTEKKRGNFLVAVALNALVNYFFFIGEVLFLVLYVLIRFVICKGKEGIKKFFHTAVSCCVEGALGLGIACILFLPSINSILQNPRSSERITLSGNLLYDGANYLLMLRALFFPAEIMSSMTVGMEFNYYSVALYLPLIGVSLVFAYLLKRKKGDWLAGMLLVCLLLAACPFLNNVFVMFTSEPYRRWFYMPILLMTLASAYVLDCPETYPWKKGILLSAAGIVLLTGYIAIHPELVLRKSRFLVITLIGAAGVLATYGILKKQKNLHWRGWMLGAVAVVAVITTNMNVWFYMYAHTSQPASSQAVYNDVIATGKALQDSLPYRYKFWDNWFNRGMPAYVPERASFHSTISPSIFEFYDALGTPRHNVSEDGPDGVNELLSVRYYVQIAPCEKQEKYQYNNGNQTVYVYEDGNALPIGFAYDTYITKSEFLQIPAEWRGHAMLKTLVVADEDEATVSKTIRHYDAARDGSFDYEPTYENKQADVNKRHRASGKNFENDTDYFSTTIDSSQAQYAFFSVPWSKDWKATVNGENAEILNVNGLMAVRIEPGENNIRFDYDPKALKIGIGLSLMCLVLSMGYMAAGRKKPFVLPR